MIVTRVLWLIKCYLARSKIVDQLFHSIDFKNLFSENKLQTVNRTRFAMESKIKDKSYLKPSPEKSLKVSPLKIPKLNKGSPMRSKTYLTPTRIYSWHKEIVSPVKEYIEGKRTVTSNKPLPLKERL